MKRLSQIFVVMMFLLQIAHADKLMATYHGQLKGVSDSSTTDIRVENLQRGQYRYKLKVYDTKKAKMRLRIKKRKLTAEVISQTTPRNKLLVAFGNAVATQELVDTKHLGKGTHEGTFTVTVHNAVGQTTDAKRIVLFKMSKKAGPRKLKYELTIFKVD